jgi:branched-chain amino acid transport system permease protein
MNRTVEYLRGPFILIVLIVISRYLFPSKMTFLVEITTFSIYIIANDILYGYMGMVSFGQPFYLGVGAYTAAIYLAHVGHDPLVAIVLAILMGLVTGAILGPAYIRLRGDYFALINAASCGLGLFLVEKTFLAFTRGDDGLWYRSRMHATPLLDLRRPDEFFWFAMIVLFLVLVWYTWLNRSTLGASFRAIKVNESKMKFLGYNTFVIRWTGFTLNCILAALAGAMFAVNYGFVNPSITAPDRAAEVLVATLLGGPGSIYGPFFGTVAFIGLRDVVSTFVSRWELAMGILTIIVCFKFRGGVWGTIQILGNKLKGLKGKSSAQSA